MSQREIVKLAGRDLLVAEEDVVTFDLAGDVPRAMDHSHLPAGSLVTPGGEARERAAWRPLGVENATVHEQIELLEQQLRPVRR